MDRVSPHCCAYNLRAVPEAMTKDEVISGLKAGKHLRVDRKDEPLLEWLITHPDIENSGVVQVEEQYSYIEFWWRH